MEIALLAAAAFGLLGCLGSAARVDVKGRRSRVRGPLVRADAR